MIERERWARLDALLDAALDREAGERQSFLRSECGADDELCREALRLLELAERGDGELAPGALAASSWDEDQDPEAVFPGVRDLPEGAMVGPYRVTGLLGRGGMGAVYEAFDPKLGRHVALKVLPPELDSEDRRRRFEREARTLAALNHPGIVHVYSIEEAGGVRFIAMERVAGRTLAQRIEPGGLPLAGLLDVAVPLADALAAAHAGGVVHRDLKPANVMVDDHGHVKVLDFGVAKWDSAKGDDDSGGVTRSGFVVGTASYMSPEQAQGGAVDQRSDVFSLGVMLFEMATGEQPFRGGSSASVISSILRDTPPSVTDLRPRLPRELSRIVRRCLAKEPASRYQSAADVRAELEQLRRALGTGEHAAATERRLVLWTGAGVVAAAAIVAALVGWRTRGGEKPPAGTFAAVTSTPGPEFFPSLSPDGQLVAYAARAGGRWDVFLQRLEGRRAINLTADSWSDDVQPAFSPDGRTLAFRSSRDGGGLFVMGATGESARRVSDRGWNPAWSPDGREIAFATQPVFETPYDRPTASELWAVELETGRTRRITEGDAVQPAWSPSGRRLAYWGLVAGGSRRDLWTVAAEGGEPVPLTADDAVDWSPAWAPDGRHLYFSSDRGGSMNLWRVAIDEASGKAEGEPERVTTPAAFAHHASFSRGGRMAYVSTTVETELQRIRLDREAARTSGAPEPLARDLRRLAFPHFSPDGEWLVFSQSEPQEDLLLCRKDGSERRSLTSDPHYDRRPRFSPDGGQIAFYSNRGGHYEIWAIARDGSGLRPLTRDPQRRNARYPVWGPDGSRLLFSRPGVTGLIVATSGDLDAPPLDSLPPPPGSDGFVPLDWSPDGRLIAGMRMTSAGERAGITLYDLQQDRYVDLVDFGLWPQWLQDGRRVVFQGPSPGGDGSDRGYPRGESAFLVDRVTRKVSELLTIPEVTVGYPTVSPDGAWLVFVRTAVKADVWTFTEDAPSSTP